MKWGRGEGRRRRGYAQAEVAEVGALLEALGSWARRLRRAGRRPAAGARTN